MLIFVPSRYYTNGPRSRAKPEKLNEMLKRLKNNQTSWESKAGTGSKLYIEKYQKLPPLSLGEDAARAIGDLHYMPSEVCDSAVGLC